MLREIRPTSPTIGLGAALGLLLIGLFVRPLWPSRQATPAPRRQPLAALWRKLQSLGPKPQAPRTRALVTDHNPPAPKAIESHDDSRRGRLARHGPDSRQWQRIETRIDAHVTRARAVGAMHARLRSELDGLAYTLESLRNEMNGPEPIPTTAAE